MKGYMEIQSEEERVEKLKIELSPLEQFYEQIQAVPILYREATDQHLLKHLSEIQSQAVQIINQLDEKKNEILKKIDAQLFPIAKEALDEMLKEAKKLKENLRENLENLKFASKVDWIEHAKCWTRLYANWYDNRELTEKVLQFASHKTKQLIDRDIQVIKDYQTQSLAQISQGTADFKRIQERLKEVTEDSLNNLRSLKTPLKDLSFKQASDWIRLIHTEREAYFDQVLMKIDSVIKDVVRQEDVAYNESYFLELEGEFHFIEHELNSIQDLMTKEKRQVDFAKKRLWEVREHLEQFDLSALSNELNKRLRDIHKRMEGLETQHSDQ
jgi:hypothetical protein